MANRSKKCVLSVRITCYSRELLSLVSKDEGRSITRITEDLISNLGTEEQKRKARVIADAMEASAAVARIAERFSVEELSCALELKEKSKRHPALP